MRNNVLRGMMFLICLTIITVPTGFAWGETDGVYTAIAADGINIKMLRYRPSVSADFNADGQPVLLIPGIFCNLDVYNVHTPPNRTKYYSRLKLPEPLADWAQGDTYIQDDPMRYYSLAHYLWNRGYDPWFFNYRGTGRGDLKSDKGINRTNLDVWALLDTDACVNKVIEITGKTPFLGGHSTGGYASYAWLQGAYFDIDELLNGYEQGYIPHVKGDPTLAATRNSMIMGYIALDPGLTPNVPSWADFNLLWRVVGLPLYINFDYLIPNIISPLAPNIVVTMGLETLFGLFNTVDRDLFSYGYNDKWAILIPYLDFWDMSNTSPYVGDYFCRSIVSSSYMRCVSQWFDIGLCNRVREHWKNGDENKYLIKPPTPEDGDGYYYYDEHMEDVTVPTIAILSYLNGIVQGQDVVDLLMNAKTPDSGDEYHIIPNTGHADIMFGLNAPYVTFPLIGDWLDRQMEMPADDETPEEYEETMEESEAQNLTGISASDSSSAACFISCIIE